MNWRGTTVLVTGAGGFIGSHLTERLVTLGARTRAFLRYNSTNLRGWLDHSPVRDEIEVVFGDIRDYGTVCRAAQGVNVVFHLAALIAIPYSYMAPLSYIRTNVEGTLNVLQAAKAAGVNRMVHTSTSEVYGTAQYVPIDEAHPLQGQSPYAASKIGADKLAEAFYLSFDLPVVIVRPFNTYGPRQSARAVIPTIILQALEGQAIRLGNLAPTRDFNYVDDTVAGFIRAAESPDVVGQVVNIGSGAEISIRDLAQTILKLIGRDVPVVREETRVRPEKSEVHRLVANSEKARRLLNWRPRYSLEEGLARTVEWVKENRGRFNSGYVI